MSGNFELDMWDDGYPGLDPTENLIRTFYLSDNLEAEGYNVGRWANEELDTWMEELYTLDEEYRQEVFCHLLEPTGGSVEFKGRIVFDL